MTLLVRVGEVRDFPQRPGTPYRLDWQVTPPGAARIRRSTYADERNRLIRFQEELLEATQDPGRQWDLSTALPQGLRRPSPYRDPARGRRGPQARPAGPGQVVLTDLIADLRARWDRLPAGTRKSETDQLVALAAALLRADTPALDATQRRLFRAWVRDQVATPVAGPVPARTGPPAAAGSRTQAAAEAAAWGDLVARHGLRWYELDEPACRTVMAAAGRRCAGHGRVAQATEGHRWAYFKRVVADAVPARLLANPLERIPGREQPSTTAKVTPVDARLVVGMGTVMAVLDTFARLASERGASPWHTVRVGLQALAGLRPEEAWAFDPDADHRPGPTPHAWGELDVRRAAPRPGSRYTDDGAQVELRGPKTVQRTLPVPPVLAELIEAARTQDAQLGRPRPDLNDPAQRNLGDALLRRTFARVRAAGHRLPHGFTGEHLRHTRISLQLATKEIPDALVAFWSGHSTMTQKRSYEGVIHTKDLRADLSCYRELLVPPTYREAQPGTAEDRLANALASLLPGITSGQLAGQSLAEALAALIGERTG